MPEALVVVALAVVLALLVALLRRGSGRSAELVAQQMSGRQVVAGPVGLDATRRHQVEALIRQGKTLEAVKLLRDYCGLKLVPAMQALDHAVATGRLPAALGPAEAALGPAEAVSAGARAPQVTGRRSERDRRARELARVAAVVHALRVRREQDATRSPRTPTDPFFGDPLAEGPVTGR